MKVKTAVVILMTLRRRTTVTKMIRAMTAKTVIQKRTVKRKRKSRYVSRTPFVVPSAFLVEQKPKV